MRDLGRRRAAGYALRLVVAIGAWLGSVGAASVSGQSAPSSIACIDCHLEQTEARLVDPARSFDNDVHAQAGFGCLACHGTGNGRLTPASGFLSPPARSEVPALCGSCHSDAAVMRPLNPTLALDQQAEYWTSQHGRLLAQTGDPDVATCTDCHPAHGIRPAADTLSSVHPANVAATCGACHSDPDVMGPRDMPTDQVEQHSASVHGRLLIESGDLGAPTCNDCHGDHGPAPAGLASTEDACGQCHAVMADLFEQSGHVDLFEEQGLAGCAACHEHHAIEPADDPSLGPRSERLCTECHAPDDPANLAFRDINLVLDSLERSVDHSRALLLEAENMGMEVSQAFFELEDVNNARISARGAIHTLSVEPVREQVGSGLEITDRAVASGQAALDEHRFRRVGLGASAVVIVLLMTALTLKIRDLEIRFEGMIGAVDRFYGGRLSQGAGATPEELRLAACTLLVEAAYADESFSEDEREHLSTLVRTRFGLLQDEAEELIALAERERESQGVGRIAKLIGANYAMDQKRALLKALRGLVRSDGRLAKREVAFLEEVASMLGMDRVEALNSLLATADVTAGVDPQKEP